MAFLSLEHGKLAYRADFAIYGLAVFGMATLLLFFAPRAHALDFAALTFAGLAAWSAIEYVFHRFLLHGMSPFREWHAAHHDRPTARIASPTIFSASLITFLVFVPAWLLADGWQACALTLGVTIGYYAYAITHHATHHWRSSNAWLLRRKRWHAAHHHAGAKARCFGVTNSFWDRIFSTN